MKATFVRLTVLVFVLIPSTASADGLLRRLPADGSWVRYQWTLTRTEGAPQLAGTITISSVGTTTVADEKCRWLELKLIYDEQQSKHLWLMKLLIPEKHFKHGDDFMKHPVRMWFKVDDMGATEKPSPKDAPEWLRRVSQIFLHAFRPLGAEGQLKERIVEYQRGKLKCRGAREQFQSKPTNLTINGDKAKLNSSTVRSLWHHDEIPFGVSECHSETTFMLDGKPRRVESVKFYLSDFGSKAKTALPNNI